MVVDLTRPGIESEPIVLIAVALSIQPLIDEGWRKNLMKYQVKTMDSQ